MFKINVLRDTTLRKVTLDTNTVDDSELRKGGGTFVPSVLDGLIDL
jgi:hypothetical protein